MGGNNAYFFAVDNNPVRVRSVRVVRAYHNSDFRALYELAFGRGPRTPASDTRISIVCLLWRNYRNSYNHIKKSTH